MQTQDGTVYPDELKATILKENADFEVDLGDSVSIPSKGDPFLSKFKLGMELPGNMKITTSIESDGTVKAALGVQVTEGKDVNTVVDTIKDALYTEIPAADLLLHDAGSRETSTSSGGSRNGRLVPKLFLEAVWDGDSLDWKDLPASEITQRVVSKVQPGSIVLFHNAALHTPEALPGIIETLLQDGYTFVPISQIILPGECGTDYTIDHTGRQCPC